MLQHVYCIYIPSLSKLLLGSLQNCSVVVGRPGQSPRDLGRFGRRDVIDPRRRSNGGGAVALLLATVAGHIAVLCWKLRREMSPQNDHLQHSALLATMANDWFGPPSLGWAQPKNYAGPVDKRTDLQSQRRMGVREIGGRERFRPIVKGSRRPHYGSYLPRYRLFAQSQLSARDMHSTLAGRENDEKRAPKSPPVDEKDHQISGLSS